MKHSLVGACFYYTTKIRYDKTDKLHCPFTGDVILLHTDRNFLNGKCRMTP